VKGGDGIRLIRALSRDPREQTALDQGHPGELPPIEQTIADAVFGELRVQYVSPQLDLAAFYGMEPFSNPYALALRLARGA